MPFFAQCIVAALCIQELQLPSRARECGRNSKHAGNQLLAAVPGAAFPSWFLSCTDRDTARKQELVVGASPGAAAVCGLPPL